MTDEPRKEYVCQCTVTIHEVYIEARNEVEARENLEAYIADLIPFNTNMIDASVQPTGKTLDY